MFENSESGIEVYSPALDSVSIALRIAQQEAPTVGSPMTWVGGWGVDRTIVMEPLTLADESSMPCQLSGIVTAVYKAIPGAAMGRPFMWADELGVKLPSFYAVLTNAHKGRELAFNAWYTNQHIRDVLQHVEGIVSARRYFCGEACPIGGFRYLVLYEVVPGRETDVQAGILDVKQERQEAKRLGSEPKVPDTDTMAEARRSVWLCPAAAPGDAVSSTGESDHTRGRSF